jgi:hypothetical protein
MPATLVRARNDVATLQTCITIKLQYCQRNQGRYVSRQYRQLLQAAKQHLGTLGLLLLDLTPLPLLSVLKPTIITNKISTPRELPDYIIIHTALDHLDCLVFDKTTLLSIATNCTSSVPALDRTWPNGDTYTSIAIGLVSICVSFLQLLLGNRISNAINRMQVRVPVYNIS